MDNNINADTCKYAYTNEERKYDLLYEALMGNKEHEIIRNTCITFQSILEVASSNKVCDNKKSKNNDTTGKV